MQIIVSILVLSFYAIRPSCGPRQMASFIVEKRICHMLLLFIILPRRVLLPPPTVSTQLSLHHQATAPLVVESNQPRGPFTTRANAIPCIPDYNCSVVPSALGNPDPDDRPGTVAVTLREIGHTLAVCYSCHRKLPSRPHPGSWSFENVAKALPRSLHHPQAVSARTPSANRATARLLLT